MVNSLNLLDLLLTFLLGLVFLFIAERLSSKTTTLFFACIAGMYELLSGTILATLICWTFPQVQRFFGILATICNIMALVIAFGIYKGIPYVYKFIKSKRREEG